VRSWRRGRGSEQKRGGGYLSLGGMPAKVEALRKNGTGAKETLLFGVVDSRRGNSTKFLGGGNEEKGF